MAETVSVALTTGAYAALGTTQTAVGAFVKRGQMIRLYVGASAPAAGTADYIPLTGPVDGSSVPTFVSFADFGIGAGDEIYARAEERDTSLVVLRGTNAAATAATTQSQVLEAIRPTARWYSHDSIGYAGYATPTDMVTLSGAAGKLVYVSLFTIRPQSTSAVLIDWYFIKRGAANTGGTAAALAATKLDSASAAASAVLSSYSVIPAGLGAAQGTVGIVRLLTTVLTTNPPAANLTAIGLFGDNGNALSTLVLREGELLAINMNGAALPAGFSASIHARWAEVDL